MATARSFFEAVSFDDYDEQVYTVERESRFQCRRYKSLGPSKARTAAREVIPDPNQPPYGAILVAPIDLSAKAVSAFRSEALSRGASEAHVWGRSAIEDQLFVGDNDHLLFAYFGISIRARRRSQLANLREIISPKRKLVTALGWGDSVALRRLDHNAPSLLVRDAEDSSYWVVTGENDPTGPAAPWQLVAASELHPAALIVITKTYLGRRLSDETWDVLPETAETPGDLARDLRFQEELTDPPSPSRFELSESIDDDERMTIQEIRVIPYVRILEVDRHGDSAFPCPHVFCEFSSEFGPYTPQVFYVGVNRWGASYLLKDDQRGALFAPGWREAAARDNQTT